jgi:hypothetical protein
MLVNIFTSVKIASKPLNPNKAIAAYFVALEV